MSITITDPPPVLADGSYALHLSGQDASGYYFVAGAFTVANGVITAGEQDAVQGDRCCHQPDRDDGEAEREQVGGPVEVADLAEARREREREQEAGQHLDAGLRDAELLDQLQPVAVGAFDLGPEVLEAVRAGKLEFAVDQQPYLQGYLPIVMLANRARYGLLPAQGDVVATGANFVTRANADQAIELSRRSIR